MSKQRRKKRRNKKSGLAGAPDSLTTNDRFINSLLPTGKIVLSGLAAAGAGAAMGKHSLWPGLLGIGLGVYKDRNPYIIAAGVGFLLSNGYQIMSGQTTQGVDGFDLKQIASQAKDRVGTFFKNFSEKLYLPASKEPVTTTAGLGEDDVTYFVNPYNKELDTSAIDRIQEQIAQMNTPVSGGMDDAEFEREF